MKITLIGCGYVGLANGIALSSNHDIVFVDSDQKKINSLNSNKCPVSALDLTHYIQRNQCTYTTTSDLEKGCQEADYVLIAVPTDFDEELGKMNTSVIEELVTKIFDCNAATTVVIKSTTPVGFVSSLSKKYSSRTILYCPEFLREASPLTDVLNPKRIIVGGEDTKAREFASLVKDCCKTDNVPILITTTDEAESIKLFSNAYLATRIAFFNELASFAQYNGLDKETIIKGVCLDPRIGDHYNKPGNGFSGSCLPKDVKQLSSQFPKFLSSLIRTLTDSNEKRLRFITNYLTNKKDRVA